MQDQQKTTKVTLYLSQELHRQLKIRSAVDGEPMSTMAERALEFYLAHSSVVEDYSDYGKTHQVYECPSCSDSVVMKDGDLVSVRNAAVSDQSDELHVDMQEIVAEGSHPEEGQLVHC